MKKVLLLIFFSNVLIIGIFFVLKYSPRLQAAAPSEKTIPLDQSLQPNDVVIDSVYHHAYITSHTTLASVPMPVTVLDTLHDTIVGVLPVSTIRAIAINTTTHRLYVGDSITHTLSVFDTNTNVQIATFSSLMVSPLTPLAFAVNEKTNRLYILSDSSTGGFISVLNAQTGAILAHAISVGSMPAAFVVNPVMNTVYVISSGVNSHISIIDGMTNSVSAVLPFTGSLEDIALDTALNKIYITNDVGTTLLALDGVTNTFLPQILIPDAIGCAHTISVDSVRHILYAACFNGLSIIDTKTNRIMQQIPLTEHLPVTHAITAQYMGRDIIFNKLYVSLEETHQVAVVTLTDPPKINTIAPITGNEGSAIHIPFSFSDSNATSWTARISFGDKTPEQIVHLTTMHSVFQHVYNDNGTYMVTVTVTNAIGLVSFLTTTATIQNVSPTVGAITTKNSSISINTSLAVQSSFIDPGIQDSHTAVWDWGDGMTSDGSIHNAYISGLITGSHTYTTPGVYAVSLIVTDKDTAITTNTVRYIIVRDLGTNAVFGEGSIPSPAGAYKQNVVLTGKMDVGLYAGYTHGVIATGSADFTFQLANFSFQSTTVDAITEEGQKIIVAGKGLVHNAGNYAFTMTIQNLKTIRIKIWDIATGIIVYDSQMNQPDSVSPTSLLESGSVISNL